MNSELEANLRSWNEAAAIHVKGSASYPVEDFKEGRAGLQPNIPDDIGEVRGKSLLHLQCHFGLDSLMWVRQGAVVTGVDFSPVAIEHAQKLLAETSLPASFMVADVCALPESINQQFDVVLTYYGTITWLGDLEGWARGIARSLKPGGFFYLADCHPFVLSWEPVPGDTLPRPASSYFSGAEPLKCVGNGGTYANPEARTTHNVTYQWQHTLQTILGALIGAGLRLDYLHEFPYTFWDKFGRERMDQDNDGWWRLREGDGVLPLMFSLRAVKP